MEKGPSASSYLHSLTKNRQMDRHRDGGTEQPHKTEKDKGKWAFGGVIIPKFRARRGCKPFKVLTQLKAKWHRRNIENEKNEMVCSKSCHLHL